MYILRQINFHEILTQPVLKFVMNLNGTEEDRKAFKERIRSDRKAGNDWQSDLESDFTINTMTTKKKPMNEDVSSNNCEQNEEASQIEETDPETAESFFVFNPRDDPTNRKGNKIIRNKQGLRPRAGTQGEDDTQFIDEEL